jgi:protein gp37
MSETTGIEWCDHTFNVAWGCMKVSPGCAHCYADTLSNRYGFDVWGPAETTERRTFGDKHWHEPVVWNRKAEKEGKRRRVFWCSMCDLMEDHPTINAERLKAWPLMKATPWLDHLVLTKRPERYTDHLPADWGEGYPNVWLGTSVESQEYIERLHVLSRVPARVRFVSFEPLLGPIEIPLYSPHAIHWGIIGGESGPGAREARPEWMRSLLQQLALCGIAPFLKQLGGHPDKRGHEKAVLDGQRYVEWPM